MSLSVTIDVFCDAPDCHAWVEGVEGRTRMAGRAARLQAKKMGWRCRGGRDGRDLDLCPKHVSWRPT